MAHIIRTEYGIPHTTADDWGSLGYGAGYAYAQDNYCVLMREIVRANGQSARYFGEDEGNLDDDPMSYLYDGELRDIEAIPVTIEVKLADGTIEALTDTIYTSHYGPVLDLGRFNSLLAGWPTALGSVLAIRDANISNTRGTETWLNINQTQSVDQLREATSLLGIPYTNTIAADRDGTAFYGDISVVPHVTTEKLDDCADSVITSGLVAANFIALNGSRSDCEWGNDPGSPAGLLGFDNLPSLTTRDYSASVQCVLS